MRTIATLASVIGILLCGGAARAESDYGFGARVGGYGFRSAAEDGSTAWDDCRMGGIGLFGQRTMTKHLFLEGALDQYFSEEGPAHMSEEPAAMDRVSTVLSVAGGLRMFPGKIITPHVEVGAGVEVTRVAMSDHHPESFVLPMAFLGFGADARITSHLRFGLTIRMNAMGHFDHHGGAGEAMSASPELASQGQFYLRYDL